jgi:hypothetical protein
MTDRLNSEIQHKRTRLSAAWLLLLLCYRQPYFSITFTILNSHFNKEKFNTRSKIFIFSIHFTFLNFLGVTLRNFKLCLYFGLKQEIVTTPFRPRYGPWFDLVSDRNGYQEYFLEGTCCRWIWPTTLPPWRSGDSASW